MLPFASRSSPIKSKSASASTERNLSPSILPSPSRSAQHRPSRRSPPPSSSSTSSDARQPFRHAASPQHVSSSSSTANMTHNHTPSARPSPSLSRSTSSSSLTTNNRNSKLDQIIQNFFTKTAHIVIQARIHDDMRKTGNRRVNKWFNMAMDEMETLRDDLSHWRASKLHFSGPIFPPMKIDIYLDTSQLIDTSGCMVDGPTRIPLSSQHSVLLEQWTLTLEKDVSADGCVDLPNVYKKSIIFFRSLYSLVRLLPGHRLVRQLLDAQYNELFVAYQISAASRQSDYHNVSFNHTENMQGGAQPSTKLYQLSKVVTPLGVFQLDVRYRTSCDIQLDVHETQTSTQFIDMDEHFFTPTMAKYREEGRKEYNSQAPSVSPASKLTVDTRSTAENQLQTSSHAPRRASSLRDTAFSSWRQSPLVASDIAPSLSTNTLSKRGNIPLISPFKSPSLSSSPQAETMFLNGRSCAPSDDKLRSSSSEDMGNSFLSRKPKFSSSFEKYKERSSPHRRESSSQLNMTRQWSVNDDHGSFVQNDAIDASLEEFMRLVHSDEHAKLFEKQCTLNDGDYSPSSLQVNNSQLYADNADMGSIYRSKKALSYYQSLKDTHTSLSESMAYSITTSTTTTAEALNTGTSLGSSSSSSMGRSYAPAVPSPLHTKHPVPLPMISTPRSLHHVPLDTDTVACSTSCQDSLDSQVASSQLDGSENRELPWGSRHGSFKVAEDEGLWTEKHQQKGYTFDTSSLRGLGHVAKGKIEFHSDELYRRIGTTHAPRRKSFLDDDDSLVFRMTELENEGLPCTQSDSSSLVLSRGNEVHLLSVRERSIYDPELRPRRMNSMTNLAQAAATMETVVEEEERNISISESSSKSEASKMKDGLGFGLTDHLCKDW
ncbi:autophagy-related protein 13-domain-containing protein [Radiomyces spectabilis]|uniref:autophagy-related protein 13-domain-containing protein n=1 Tax=Radiomyces spectabilis TaxID=64574 RepID=UPI00221EB5CE|nr:autophagy-related protein 13-domain-containing protein [Radiomyces spectabilis]KAI8394093.1 autophagy-related protein 13-domain-containing protein [Radiomyces spectabilis]